MNEWRDWYSNGDMFKTIYNDLCSIDENRLNQFATKIEEKYKEDDLGDEWFYRDIAHSLKVLNESMRAIENSGMDYVWVIDCFENEGIFEPNRERLMDCIKRIEKWTEVKF